LAVANYQLRALTLNDDLARFDAVLAPTGGTIVLWDLATGKSLATLRGHSNDIWALEFQGNGRTLVSHGWDGTALVWSVPTPPPLPDSKGLTKERLGELMQQLTSDDAEAAWKALWALVAAGDEATAVLRQKLPAVPALDPTTVARYRDALNSDKFADRENATKELKQMGPAAEPLQVALLRDLPTLELRLRVEALLKPLLQPLLSPAQVQAVRMLEVLERIGNKKARAVLAEIARGAPEAWLTREAQGCVQRLEELNAKQTE
jgi:hypothetical protein